MADAVDAAGLRAKQARRQCLHLPFAWMSICHVWIVFYLKAEQRTTPTADNTLFKLACLKKDHFRLKSEFIIRLLRASSDGRNFAHSCRKTDTVDLGNTSSLTMHTDRLTFDSRLDVSSVCSL
ncbi:hypothetical protein T08_8746 [Trichinella sp. T8]|uniref:Uncharacterized protein n=1 Tax=Trichinella murrelli TaxID=144512 RepID=A0A0V0U8F6_9BILA|nr:hypothetical protein T05_10889 [Trichinella murrelli]KRZ88368.1 hypothetical protein T08_8746 [Trichinella sp. T8]